MKIRYANPKDFSAVKKLDRELNTQQIRQKIQMKEIILAIQAGEPVGYLKFEWFWGKIPYLTWVFTQPELRGQGIANKMLEILKSKLAANSQIMSSYQDNAPQAKQWHNRTGFKKCGKISLINKDQSDEIFCMLIDD